MTAAILASLLALASAAPARTIDMSVTEKGFEPSKITVKKGEPLKDAGIRKELPLDKAVAIDFTPAKSGEIRYVCGMDNITGVLLVE